MHNTLNHVTRAQAWLGLAAAPFASFGQTA